MSIAIRLLKLIQEDKLILSVTSEDVYQRRVQATRAIERLFRETIPQHITLVTRQKATGYVIIVHRLGSSSSVPTKNTEENEQQLRQELMLPSSEFVENVCARLVYLLTNNG